MRRVLLDRVQPGAVLGDDLFSPKGVRILTRGTTLAPKHLAHLEEMGLEEVLIEDPALADIEIKPSLSSRTRQIGLTLFSHVADRAAASGGYPVEVISRPSLEPFLEQLTRDLDHGADRPYELVAVAGNDYLPGHALNAAGLAGWMAMKGPLKGLALDMALAGLLADLGMMRVPHQVRFKRDSLTPDEMEQVKEHVNLSVRLIGRSFTAYTKTAISAHHERLDGSGYPRGLKGEDIHEAARLLAVVDTYLALVSDRPHRRRMPAHEALEMLMGLAGVEFDMEVVNLLMRAVAPFPLGVSVRLASGRSGVVVRQGQVVTRPVIRVMAEPDGRVEPWDMDLSLAKYQTEMVAEVLYD